MKKILCVHLLIVSVLLAFFTSAVLAPRGEWGSPGHGEGFPPCFKEIRL